MWVVFDCGDSCITIGGGAGCDQPSELTRRSSAETWQVWCGVTCASASFLSTLLNESIHTEKKLNTRHTTPSWLINKFSISLEYLLFATFYIINLISFYFIRFDSEISVPVPSAAARLNILRNFLQHRGKSAAVKEIAHRLTDTDIEGIKFIFSVINTYKLYLLSIYQHFYFFYVCTHSHIALRTLKIYRHTLPPTCIHADVLIITRHTYTHSCIALRTLKYVLIITRARTYTHKRRLTSIMWFLLMNICIHSSLHLTFYLHETSKNSHYSFFLHLMSVFYLHIWVFPLVFFFSFFFPLYFFYRVGGEDTRLCWCWFTSAM